MRSDSLLTLILAAFAISACKPPDTKDKATADHASSPKGDAPDSPHVWARGIKNFVNRSDLKPSGTLLTMNKKEVDNLVSEHSIFYAHSDDPEKTEDRECFDKLRDAATFQVTGQAAALHAKLDARKCATRDVTYSKFDVTIDLAGACENGDLTVLDGMTLEEANKKYDGKSTCDDGGTAHISRTISELEYEKTSRDAGKTRVVSVSMRTLYLLASADGAPCHSTQATGFASPDDCVEVSFQEITALAIDGKPQPKQVGVRALTARFQDLKAQIGNDPYYESGSMDVEVNDWSGKVIYEGSKVQPTYSLSFKSEQASGKIALPKSMASDGDTNRTSTQSRQRASLHLNDEPAADVLPSLPVHGLRRPRLP